MTRRSDRENETDADGHRWHSPEYVGEWIRARESDASPAYSAAQRHRLEALLAAVPHDRDARVAILDLGAGWGRLARHLLDAFPAGRLVAHDFSHAMLDQARSHLTEYADRVDYAGGDLEEAGLVTHLGTSFDVVVTSQTLHHVSAPRLESLYHEIHEALRTGGVFVNLDRVRRRSVALLHEVARRAPALADPVLALRGVIGAGDDDGAHGATRAAHLRMLATAGFAVSARTVEGMVLMVGVKAGG